MGRCIRRSPQGATATDGTRVYSWDAENRLVAVAPAVPAAGDKKVVFTYDYMSRRAQKRVFAWNATLNGGAGDWEANPEVYQRFVYDQWNVVLVLDGPNRTITHKYTWGLDLSGLAGQGAAGGAQQSRDREGAVPGIHGAGGIGGLLAVEAPQAEGDPLRHWYFYDGNGNVGQLLAYDATGPTVNAAPAAKYEYDPYGQLIQTAGTYADANPFRFSTKWFDTTTGLGDWGYRYYSPRLGRWMSRDPIGERGGLNLLSSAGNAATNFFDFWGLSLEMEVGIGWGPWVEAELSADDPVVLGDCCFKGKKEELVSEDFLLRIKYGLGVGVKVGSILDLAILGPTANIDVRTRVLSCGGQRSADLCAGPSVTMGVEGTGAALGLRAKVSGTATGGLNVCAKIRNGRICTFAKFTGEYNVSISVYAGPWMLKRWGETDQGEEYLWGEDCAMAME